MMQRGMPQMGVNQDRRQAEPLTDIDRNPGRERGSAVARAASADQDSHRLLHGSERGQLLAETPDRPLAREFRGNALERRQRRDPGRRESDLGYSFGVTGIANLISRGVRDLIAFRNVPTGTSRRSA